jgi:hypothetical protein
MGFDGKNEAVEIVQRFEDWQRTGDERFWKTIVSPEFGDRADLSFRRSDIEDGNGSGNPAGLRLRTTTRNTPRFTFRYEAPVPKAFPTRFSRGCVREGIREIA